MSDDRELKKKLQEAQRSIVDLAQSLKENDHLKDDHEARYEMDEVMDEFNDLVNYLNTHPHMKRLSNVQPLKTQGDYGEDHPESLPPEEEKTQSAAQKALEQYLSDN